MPRTTRNSGYMSKEQLHTLIESNPAIFTQNGSFTEEQLNQWFNLTVPSLTGTVSEAFKKVRNFNLIQTTAYTSLNKILRLRGLRVRRQNNTFHISSETEARETVQGYHRRSSQLQTVANQLQQGINQHHSSWSPLTTEELRTITSVSFQTGYTRR